MLEKHFTSEKQHLESLSNWYLQEQLDFDKKLIYFRYQTIKPHLTGLLGLELGSGDGQMTQYLINHFEELTVIDGSLNLLNQIPEYPNLVKVHSLFENFDSPQKFNSIIMEHILEHVKDPIELLKQVQKWLTSKGTIIIGVPNGNSIHRLVAVKMGLLKESCELNQRDHALGHRRVYTSQTFRQDLEASGLIISHIGGVFFKPLSNQQIQDHWTEQMIQGFYELGKDFPEYAAEIYAVCELP